MTIKNNHLFFSVWIANINMATYHSETTVTPSQKINTWYTLTFGLIISKIDLPYFSGILLQHETRNPLISQILMTYFH